MGTGNDQSWRLPVFDYWPIGYWLSFARFKFTAGSASFGRMVKRMLGLEIAQKILTEVFRLLRRLALLLDLASQVPFALHRRTLD